MMEAEARELQRSIKQGNRPIDPDLAHRVGSYVGILAAMWKYPVTSSKEF
jgi:hypothetical protein